MPGGTYEQKITIKNPSDRRVEIYLRGEPLNASQEGANLLSKVKFTLVDQYGHVLVSDASDTSMQNSWRRPARYRRRRNHSLGRFYSATAWILRQLQIPPICNSIRMLRHCRWTFQADVNRRDDDTTMMTIRRYPLGPPVIIINDDQQSRSRRYRREPTCISGRADSSFLRAHSLDHRKNAKKPDRPGGVKHESIGARR